MKLSPRTAKFLFAPTVALCMSAMMSFALTIINQGINANFIFKWLTSFGISFFVALPLAMLAIPLIQKFFDRFTEKPDTTIAENLGLIEKRT
jgi:Protein of unknown function (DUF2798)